MALIKDPYSGLHLVELSHIWGMGAPSYPGQEDVRMFRSVKHAQHGVLAWKVRTDMHSGTHMIAPIHMAQRGKDMAAVDAARFFGNGVVLDLTRKANFDRISAEDLKQAGEIREGDIVVINTGWHRKYSDGLEYFGQAPGLTRDAADYLIGKAPKLVAVDTPFIDCPLATSMGPHRGGPQMKRLARSYADATGRDPAADYPQADWYPAHRALAYADIPVIQQVGGDVDLLTGRRATLVAAPWKFLHADACIVRFMALLDPDGTARIDAGV